MDVFQLVESVETRIWCLIWISLAFTLVFYYFQSHPICYSRVLHRFGKVGEGSW